MDYKQITSIQALLDKLNENPNCLGEFFIQFGYGVCSWKGISLADNDRIYVFNEIDESEEFIDIADLDSDKTILGEAIRKGALYFAWF